MAAVLSLDAAFQIGWLRSGGMNSGELIRDPLICLYQRSFIPSSGSSLPMHALSTNRRVICNGAIEATPVTNWATCIVLQCHRNGALTLSLMAFLSGQSSIDFVGEARQPFPRRRARRHCLLFLYWCGGIDQLIRWLGGQGLSVLMPVWQMCSLLTTAVTQSPFEHVPNKWGCIPEFAKQEVLL